MSPAEGKRAFYTDEAIMVHVKGIQRGTSHNDNQAKLELGWDVNNKFMWRQLLEHPHRSLFSPKCYSQNPCPSNDSGGIAPWRDDPLFLPDRDKVLP